MREDRGSTVRPVAATDYQYGPQPSLMSLGDTYTVPRLKQPQGPEEDLCY